jgi:hypothetical protein
MTKKDYEKIALAFQKECPPKMEDCTSGYTTEYLTWLSCIGGLSKVFADDNPRFDQERFLRACVPGANVRARKS